ncbi:MAG: chromate efflux transporter [Chitinophagaceae bacterium]|nr:chromate efflux transporter [Chitinophagaceae bacterium]
MKQSYAKLFLRFLRFGCLAFGGPVAQIAMIKKELVDEEKWISKEQFNRALAVYQVLPGPEAHELCVYFGMKAKCRWGGFLAGLGFMLPGLLLMLLLTWFYVEYGIRSPMIKTLFTGIQAAVVSLIVFAVYRIGKHSMINYKLFIIAVCSSISFFLGVNFLIILFLAGFSYVFWNKGNILAIAFAVLLVAITTYTIYQKGFTIKTGTPVQTAIAQPNNKPTAQIFITGLKGGLLSFGGAYTAIPIIQQDAVIKKQWMTREQFLDGIALSGILPAPLIIFSTFVGYFGGGWWGAIIITIGIFLPAFSFTLIGHSLLEKLIANTSLHSFLDGVTAGVIGLIAITAIKLFLTTITGIPAFIIFFMSLLVLIKFKSKYMVIFIILGAGLFSLVWSLL